MRYQAVIIRYILVLCFAFVTMENLHSETPPVLRFFKASSSTPSVSDADLELKAEHGPWLILAASFDGPEAHEKALELARELRKEYKLHSYVLPKQFDFTQTVQGSGFDSQGKQKKMKYADDRKVEGYGVLVGDFDSLDNPALQDMLKRVKTLKPKTLTGKEDVSKAYGTVSAYRRMIISKSDKAATASGPMATAFMIKNPLLPEDFFQPPKMDKFIKNLNQQAENSLLDCKSRFTVRVATFRGQENIVVGKSRSGDANTNIGEALEHAAEQAHLAASVLRSAGYEAYEFHDRNMSIVTVGGFDSLGNGDSKGKFVYDPKIQKVIKEFGGAKDFKNSQVGPVPVARTLLDIVNYRKIPELNTGTEAEKLVKVKRYSVPFDPEPKPMAIPRPETNGLYSGSLLGRK